MDTGISLSNFLSLYWLITLAVGLLWLYLYKSKSDPGFLQLIGWAIIFRLTGVYGSPIMEDDFYRFLLDGCTFEKFGTPYGITPQSLFLSNQLSRACQSALNWVNNPDLPTIYGPVLQYLFLLAHTIAPANINVLQLILTAFDITLILILRPLVKYSWLLLYAWNPLVIKELAFSAHPDIVGIAFMVAALLAWRKQFPGYAAFLIALACASKIFALIAVPYILYKQKLLIWLIFVATLVLLYFPFVLAGSNEFSVLGTFADRWIFNPLGYFVIKSISSEQIARYICLSLFALFWGSYFFWYQQGLGNSHFSSNHNIPRFDWLFGLFLFLSPVINAWYLIWILPFAVIYPSFWAWSLVITAPLTYITGLNLDQSNLGSYQIHIAAYLFQAAIIATALFFDFRRFHTHRSKNKF